MNGKLFIVKIHVQNRNIVGDSVRKLAYDINQAFIAGSMAHKNTHKKEKFQHVLSHYRKSILRQI